MSKQKKKTLSEYDFTPDQQLVSSVTKKTTDTPLSVKIVMLVLLLAVALFFMGHFNAIYGNIFDVDFTENLMTHISSTPFDVFHFSMLSDSMLLLVWIVIALLYLFPANGTPKGDMKGEEHGSNDFQTIEERKVFMRRCSTPIHMLNVDIVKQYEKTHTKGVKNA